jgi:hypothetical protein
MPLVSRRGLCVLAISAGVVVSMCTPTAQAAPAGPAASQVSHNVIVVLRDQHTNLAIAKGRASARVAANRKDESSHISRAKQFGARNLSGFATINGYAATVTPSQAAQLTADPSVAAIVPDLQIKASPALQIANAAAAAPGGNQPQSGNICPIDPAKPLLEPEALQVTHTAFNDASTPQAQHRGEGGLHRRWRGHQQPRLHSR